ncbi:MAG: hypothetical protein KF781_00790 [Chitinophagaceae bacterium]|nr:hypothetical protein [Chitinophagaceae bacterium]MCW5905271.1 hypothetical protein [Chitinophagaceae bacterium]
MKQIFFMLLCIMFVTTYTNAQNTTDTATTKRKKVIVKTFTKKPAQAIYAEVGGNSLLWSLNYDRRFSNRLDGVGFRAGVGYFPLGGSNLLVVPFGINILAGNKGHFVEMGLNATVVSASSKNKSAPTVSKFGQLDFTGNKTNMLYGASMGYRYQKPDAKGFHFRAGVEPILGNRYDDKMVFAITGHISIGYSF